MFNSSNFFTIGAKPSLWKTEIKADFAVLFVLILGSVKFSAKLVIMQGFYNYIFD